MVNDSHSGWPLTVTYTEVKMQIDQHIKKQLRIRNMCEIIISHVKKWCKYV
jgi:hypothetical protein